MFALGQLLNEGWRLRAIIDLAASDFKSHRPSERIDGHVNFTGVACSAFADGLLLTASGSRAMLVRLGVAAIDEHPFQVGFYHQRLKDLEPFARGTPGVEPLVDLTPGTKGWRQVAPRAANAHSIQHSLYRHA